MFLNTRHLFLLVWLGCSFLIAVALYMQYFLDLVPCALCMTQRVFVIIVGVLALIAWLHQPTSSVIRIYAVIGGLMAIIGGGFSSRHLWLQNLPEELVPACGPSLSYLLEAFPISEALRLLLRGDGNCAESLWSLFGITIPGWTLIAFIGFLVLNCWIFYKSFPKQVFG